MKKDSCPVCGKAMRFITRTEKVVKYRCDKCRKYKQKKRSSRLSPRG